MRKPSLSVVLPTYNCEPLMARHLDSMDAWADLADEIIVVDSRSTDGTLELIRNRLRHPNIRIIERGPGLYESWNEGIATTKGHWVYLSTAGDTIERAHLLNLMEAGAKANADVVISPCRFVDATGRPLPGTTKGNPHIMRGFGGETFVVEPPDVRDHVAMGAGIQGLLGSCASDLFRGEFLRNRPFPTNYGTHGDSAWMLRHAHEIRLCVVPELGSTFCRHVKHRLEDPSDLDDIYDRIYVTEIRHGGPFPGLTLSLGIRSLRSRRKRYAREDFPLKGFLASLAGTLLRGLLAAAQIPSRIRRLRSVKPLASAIGTVR